MSSNPRFLLEPTTSPHPGELVTEYLEFFGWSHSDLAHRTGLTPKTIREICEGNAESLSAETEPPLMKKSCSQ